MRAPRRCLRSSCPSTRPDESRLGSGRDLVFEPLQYTEALGLTSSRSSDYSLVKELSRSQTAADDFHRLCRAVPDFVPVRGGGIIASAARLSTGCRENCSRSVRAAQTATPASSESLSFKGVALATSGRLRNARVQAPEPKPAEEWLCQTVRIMPLSVPFVKAFRATLSGMILPITLRRDLGQVHARAKNRLFINC